MGKVINNKVAEGTEVDTSLRINDYLNNRPAPTGTTGTGDTGNGGGRFTVVDRRYEDTTRTPSDGKAIQLSRSVVARKLSGDRLPTDHIEAAMEIVRKFKDRAHISEVGPLTHEAYSRCPEFVALGKK